MHIFRKEEHKGRTSRGLLLAAATITFCMFLVSVLLVACARMGQPDGGWYDEVPPRVVGANPVERATDVSSKRLEIRFSEFIKLENATENVVICPPQIEQPEIKTMGKVIRIDLKDSLKANTTYTIDFSDAITDNNENNPMGNFTYVFSTGKEIDTLEVAGYVLNAEDLEPVKGSLVGLYDNLADSAFTTQPMLRIGRTDGSGHFRIRGIATTTLNFLSEVNVLASAKMSSHRHSCQILIETLFGWTLCIFLTLRSSIISVSLQTISASSPLCRSRQRGISLKQRDRNQTE